MAERYISINNFSGGLSDSSVKGIEGSFAEGVGLDIHSNPGLLTVNQALKKNSGSTIDEFCRFAVYASDGSSYYFGDSGGVFKRTSAGVWSHPKQHGAAIVGAAEFDDYLYCAEADTLHRYGLLSGTPSWSDDWRALTSATYHPMTSQGLYLYIGNKTQIASVDDAGTFTANGTPDVTVGNLPHQYQITALENFGIDILMGTSATEVPAKMFRWDTVSPTWNTKDDFSEFSIKAILSTELGTFIFAGDKGNIYFYDGVNLLPFKKLSGTYSSSKYLQIYPDSVASFNGKALFGVSNGAGNSTKQGIYTIGRYDKNYSQALNLGYVISPDKTSSVEVGAILPVGQDLFAAWKDGTTYGVDKIDPDNKYTGAYLKTLAIMGNRHRNKNFKNYVIGYKSKPTGTALALKYSKNYGTETSLTIDQTDTVNQKIRYQKNLQAGVMQLRTDFTVSGNSAPIVENIYCDWVEEDQL